MLACCQSHSPSLKVKAVPNTNTYTAAQTTAFISLFPFPSTYHSLQLYHHPRQHHVNKDIAVSKNHRIIDSLIPPAANSFLTRFQKISSIFPTFHKLDILGTSSTSHSNSFTLLAAISDHDPAFDQKFLLYDTMTQSKKEFVPIQPPQVQFYACGPTVYDYAHVGNFRAFLTYDLLKRWLTVLGYQVNHITNLTDIDDKIIKRFNQRNQSKEHQNQQDTIAELRNWTQTYVDIFMEDSKMINIIPAKLYPRATDHINEIVDVVKTLKKKGFAYEKAGSTYFKVDAFETYGKLVRLEKRLANDHQPPSHSPDTTKTATFSSSPSPGIDDADEYDKDNARDFALWKSYKEDDGPIVWDTELGKGRPGWHIECSCMALKYLGSNLDIHAGGIDLVFPHHENEIAQTEAFSSSSPMANYWVHNGFVNINREKMSKSLGNFKTLRDLVKAPEDARAFRYLVISSQYRSTLNFSEDALSAAKKTVKRIDALKNNLQAIQKSSGVDDQDIINSIGTSKQAFNDGMNDDLNTSRASAAMFTLIKSCERAINNENLGKDAANKVLDALVYFDQVFGIFYDPQIPGYAPPADSDKINEIPENLKSLLEDRADARKNKDWDRADQIRKALAEAGFNVKDTPEGPKLIPLTPA